MSTLGTLALLLLTSAPLSGSPPQPALGLTLTASAQAAAQEEPLDERWLQREARRDGQRELRREARLEGKPWRPPPGPPPGPPPHRLGPVPQDPQARQAERLRLEAEVAELRRRLEQAGAREAERRRPNWWDLPSRRGQAMRLRQLRRLHYELDRRLHRLEQLREASQPQPETRRKSQ